MTSSEAGRPHFAPMTNAAKAAMDVGTMAWMPPMPGLRMLRAKKQATPATMEATAPEALASFQ